MIYMREITSDQTLSGHKPSGAYMTEAQRAKFVETYGLEDLLIGPVVELKFNRTRSEETEKTFRLINRAMLNLNAMMDRRLADIMPPKWLYECVSYQYNNYTLTQISHNYTNPGQIDVYCLLVDAFALIDNNFWQDIEALSNPDFDAAVDYMRTLTEQEINS